VSHSASELRREFDSALGTDGVADLGRALEAEAHVVARYLVAHDWVSAFVSADSGRAQFRFDIAECAALLAAPDVASRHVPGGGVLVIADLVADHPRIVNGVLTTRLDAMADAVGSHFQLMAERWPAYQAARARVVARYHDVIRLDEHRPRVMPGFVRNQLIDEALLPLFGSNLARQLGTSDPTDVARPASAATFEQRRRHASSRSATAGRRTIRAGCRHSRRELTIIWRAWAHRAV
jgi:hypothetical protein